MSRLEQIRRPVQDSAAAHGPLWWILVNDRRRHERILGVLLWLMLLAVLFNVGR